MDWARILEGAMTELDEGQVAGTVKRMMEEGFPCGAIQTA